MKAERQPLPVDAQLPSICESLSRERCLVLEAPPGAGKTTRVPPALLEVFKGEILVLEPRRLAARLAARRVASELGERVGDTAGYRVRFEEAAGPRTRLTFMTEGVLTRRLLRDRSLRGVDAVILDEFHERHLEGDLALALLRHLQKTSRPDLRLIVMSATIEAKPVAAYLGGCPMLRSEGKRFEVALNYTPVSAEPLERQVAIALEKFAHHKLDGDVLVFLPGAAEIRRAARACEPLASRANLLLLPLHGDLTPEEQDRAVQPASCRKVILSTNVAESSVTIDGVTAVIDSGLARVPSQSPWSGLPRLDVSRISKASADQRAGRAGRTAPGRVVRLYPIDDFVRRPDHETPEILRAELSPFVLALAAAGFSDARQIEWLDPPPGTALAAARQLLEDLGAIDGKGQVTADGRQMAHMPLHPRLARLTLEAARLGNRDAGCAIAALLSSGARITAPPHEAGPSDLFALVESEWGRHARLAFKELSRMVPHRHTGGGEDALLKAALAAFPDRVARRRRGDELLLANGGSALLSGASIVRSKEFIVAIDVEERRERGLPLVRLASGIEPEWLLDMFPGRIRERESLEWNRTAERVEASSALLYDELTIEQSRRAPQDSEQAAVLLARNALEAGLERFADVEQISGFLDRVRFAARHANVPKLTEEDTDAALASLCRGLVSFTQLKAAAGDGKLLRALEQRLPPQGLQAVNEYAPGRVRLPAGKYATVRYPPDQDPWIAAKLQEFFGMQETPRVARGRVPLVLHLLAPNDRPVQTTSDLAGFWQRLYPEVRRELSRRYPRHRWPENPFTAQPGAHRRR